MPWRYSPLVFARLSRPPLPMNPDTRELQVRLLPLSREARQLLGQFADVVEAAQANGGDYSHVSAFASKAAEQAARIAGTLAAWSDLDATEVSAETMADAIGLASFYLDEAVRLADTATVSAEIEKAEKLRVWLLTRWEHHEIMPRDVVRLAPIRALRESPAAKAALAVLVRHGWLVPLDPGTEVQGKPRREAYRIVRAGHEV